MQYAIFVELAHVDVIRETGSTSRESSTEVTTGCSSGGVGVRGQKATQLQLSYTSDTCSKQLNQHSPVTRTAHQEQTLEIFRSVHSGNIFIFYQNKTRSIK